MPPVDTRGKDAIIRHLRGENERLEKLVLDAVNAGEKVATEAMREQVRRTNVTAF